MSGPLTQTQIESFVRDGYLILRGCFDPGFAARTVAKVIADPSTRMYRRDVGGEVRLDAETRATLTSLEALDASRIGRVDVETGLQLEGPELSPRLWGAIVQLVGGEAELRPRRFGDRWILNTRRPSWTTEYWHVDGMGPSMSLREQRDALLMLVLWSKVEPGGGGTLVCPGALDAYLEQIAASPAGVDNTAWGWGAELVSGRETIEFTGDPGDVLIAHPFVLHAASRNVRPEVRVLENPTVCVRRPLRYTPHAAGPSPVERVIAERMPAYASLTAIADSEHERQRRARASMLAFAARHADVTLPGRRGWAERSAAVKAEAVAWQAALIAEWVRELAAGIVAEHDDAIDRLRGLVPRIRSVVLSADAILGPQREGDVDALDEPDFWEHSFARLLRGFTSDAGLADLAWRVVRAMDMPAEVVRLGRRVAVRVATPDGDAVLSLVDDPGLFGAGALARVPGVASLPPSLAVSAEVVATPALDAGVEVPDPHPDGPGDASAETPWQAYLAVRVAQIRREPELDARWRELQTRVRLGGTTARLVAALSSVPAGR